MLPSLRLMTLPNRFYLPVSGARPAIDPLLVWNQCLEKYDRIALAGGPQVGKTTLAKTVTDRPVFHSDDFKRYDWAAVPHKMIELMSAEDRFLVEGVMVARALRKGLEVDLVVVLHEPMVPRLKGQVAMEKGILTILDSLRLKAARIDFWQKIELAKA